MNSNSNIINLTNAGNDNISKTSISNANKRNTNIGKKARSMPPLLHYWGDLLISVPLIMCGHLKMDYFQASIASSFDANPLSTCPLMIVKYSGQAPRPFPHPFHGMSAHEMSGHDP